MKSPIDIIQCLQYFPLLFVTLLIPLSVGVGVQDDLVFCYPGTYCWRATRLTGLAGSGEKYPDWPPLCYHGGHQSPINLPAPHNTSGTLSLHLNNRSYRRKKFYIWNTGSTIQIKPVNPYPHPRVVRAVSIQEDEPENSILQKREEKEEPKTVHQYNFVQAHFHWAENNSFGSEHTINGSHYSLEMHLVHYSDKYPSFEDAAASNDHTALLVLALLFTADDTNPDNPLFKTINKRFPMEYEENNTIQIDLTQFLPKQNATFFRYFGGLTTPDCFEIVLWAVFSKPIPISTQDMRQFRNSTDVYHHHFHNFREPQHGNLRTIFFYKLRDDLHQQHNTTLIPN